MTAPLQQVLLLLTGKREAQVVRAIDKISNVLQVVRRCADLAELLAAAQTGYGDIVLIDLETEGLDATVVSRLQHLGLAVVLCAPPSQTDRAYSLGVAVTTTDTPAERIVAVLEREAGTDASERTVDIPVETTIPKKRGVVVAVWSGPGSPGRTVIATECAAALAHRGHRTLLVDADTVGPALAQTLGLQEETSAIAVACRAAVHGRLSGETFARMTVPVAPHLALLPGLTRADRWREVPGVALAAVLECATAHYAAVVVDLPGGLTDPDGNDDARRDEATRAVLQAANVVLLTGSADPVGMRRLIQAHANLTEHGLIRPAASVEVVINRVRQTVAGRRPHEEVVQVIGCYLDYEAVTTLSEDRETCDRALMAGCPIREVSACRIVTEIETVVERICSRYLPLLSSPERPRRSRRGRHERSA